MNFTNLLKRSSTSILLFSIAITTNATAGTITFSDSTFGFVLRDPNGANHSITLTGTSTIVHNLGPGGAASDTDFDGLDQIAQLMTAMSVSGMSAFGVVNLTLAVTPTIGQTEEQVNTHPGILNFPASSFFDVFFELELPAITLHNQTALNMTSVLGAWPPAGTYTQSSPFLSLHDAAGDDSKFRIMDAFYIPGRQFVEDVPEPGTWTALVGLGLLSLARLRRRNRGALP